MHCTFTFQSRLITIFLVSGLDVEENIMAAINFHNYFIWFLSVGLGKTGSLPFKTRNIWCNLTTRSYSLAAVLLDSLRRSVEPLSSRLQKCAKNAGGQYWKVALNEFTDLKRITAMRYSHLTLRVYFTVTL